MTTTQPAFALNFSGQAVFERDAELTGLLRSVAPDDHAQRARLHAAHAAARIFTAPEGARVSAQQALLAAGAAGDDGSRAWSLLAASAVDLSCEKTPERAAMMREVLAIAQSARDIDLAQPAYFISLAALAELAEVDELDRALSPTNALFSVFPALAAGRHASWFRCLRATIDGQVERAEQLASHGYAVASAEGDPDAVSVWVGQLAILRWMQGRVVELEDSFLQARQAAPHEPIWAVSLAWVWMRQGRRSAARGLVTSLPAMSEMPVDRNWLATMCILATVVAELDERETAAQLREMLLPFEGRLVTIGLGITCWGTVSRPLALLAEQLGDRAGAIIHHRRAIETSARIGAHPWLAESQSELAALLADGRGDAAQHREARELVGEAAATARALQLHGIENAVEAILSAVVAAAERVESAGVGEGAEAADVVHALGALPAASGVDAFGEQCPTITVLGDFEVRTSDGTVTRWQSRKARALLKILVARRGVAVRRQAVMHMLWPDEAPDRVANRFSVAATAVRRAFDPSGIHPSDRYLETVGGLVRLRLDTLHIDSEVFYASASTALRATGPPEHRAARLREALELYTGEPLTDDPEEQWAEQLRRELHIVFFAAAHALAHASETLDDHLSRVDAYRRILAVDPYDQRAHEGLIDALTQLRSSGQVARAQRDYEQRMSELGITASDSASVMG